MAYSHLGHNCEIGSSVVIANSVQIAGHVVVADRAVIGGCLGIHQFVHIGYLAMVGGMTRVDRDVPPYCLAEGHPGRMRGLNKVGIKRQNIDKESKEEYLQFIISSQNYVFWKNYYPKQTLFSILNFPIEKIDKHLADTFQCYLKLDFDAATDFLKKQDLATKHKDLAIEIIARSLKDDELAMAVLWAQDIHDVAKRHSLIEELATH